MNHSFSPSATLRRVLLLSVVLLILLLALPVIVFADNVQNNVVVSVNDTMPLGGSTIVSYRINPGGGSDGEPGCNATTTSPALLIINTPAGVTATPPSLTFSACNAFQSTTFTATSAGDFPITVSVIDSGPGAYSTSDAAFTLHVLAPADTTPPVITPNVVGTLGNNGWYTSDVNVSWSVVDNESTVTSMTGCGPTTINTDTSGTTLTCSATSAGGSNSASVTIKRDATAPTISGSASPPPNGAGWNNGPVNISFTCGDNLSGIASCGPDQTISTDGADQSRTGTAIDNAGNTTGATVSGINIDATDPIVTITPNIPANGNGWNNTDVTFTFSGSDGSGSGIASCDSPVTISTEGPNQGVSGTCTDNAGNVGSASTTVSIDKTPPTVAANISPMPTNGWNNGPVSVSFSGSDALSGIDSCDPSVPVNAEGANQLVTGTCTDNAGNMANASATVNIDTTPPVVAATANPAPNANGWNNTDVIVTFSVVSDNLSGAGTCDPAATVSGPGQNLSATGSCSDLAGNSASASASGINIDKTAPTVEVTGVAHNVVYTLGSVPAAGCSTSDALSGVATNATLSSGGPVGLITATCSGATDNAGNGAASVSVTYRVIYDFDGFFRPVDNLPMMNVVKAGSAIPVKFSLNGNFGLNIFAANSPSVSQSVSCMALPADVISPSDTVTAGGSSLSYDAVSDQYNYVWKTDRSWAGQCRVLQVTLSDGTIHLAYFHFSR